MSNTLPPGWTGNYRCHKTEIARADGLAAVEAFARKLLDEVAKLRTEAT